MIYLREGHRRRMKKIIQIIIVCIFYTHFQGVFSSSLEGGREDSVSWLTQLEILTRDVHGALDEWVERLENAEQSMGDLYDKSGVVLPNAEMLCKATLGAVDRSLCQDPQGLSGLVSVCDDQALTKFSGRTLIAYIHNSEKTEEEKRVARELLSHGFIERGKLRKLIESAGNIINACSWWESESYDQLKDALQKKKFDIVTYGYAFEPSDFQGFDAFCSAVRETPTFYDFVGATDDQKETEMLIGRYLKLTPQDIIEKTFPIVSKGDFVDTLSAVAEKLSIMQQEHWFDQDVGYVRPGRRPVEYVEMAKTFPTNACVHMIGDLHGDLNSIFEFFKYTPGREKTIEGSATGALHRKSYFKKGSWELKEQFKHLYFVFHGDMVDGGSNGEAVLYFVSKIFLANPENIVLLRGNHEDLKMNECGGFYAELEHKYGPLDSEIKNTLENFYASLPVALWAEINGARRLFVHGSIDPADINLPAFFRAQKKSRDQLLYKLVKAADGEVNTNYQWAECREGYESYYNPHRGYQYGIDYVAKYLNSIGVEAIVNGHNHSVAYGGFMPDIIKLGAHFLFTSNDIDKKEPKATTLSVMPGNGYGFPKNAVRGDGWSDQGHYRYPAVVHISAGILTVEHDREYFKIVQFPNKYIVPAFIKAAHVRLMEELAITQDEQVSLGDIEVTDPRVVKCFYRDLGTGERGEMLLEGYSNFKVPPFARVERIKVDL